MIEARQNEPGNEGTPKAREVTRRDVLKAGVVGAGVVAATAAALEPLKDLDEFPSIDQFLQKYYRELSPEDKANLIERVTTEVKDKYGVDANVTDPRPQEGVEFAYCLNIGRCIGCRKCVHACVAENNQSRDPEIQYIRVLKMKAGSLDVEKSDHHYDDNEVPEEGYFYMPVQCHQCSNPPCVKVCPTKATWKEEDGIVVIDYDWCIGCRYCMSACPYFARRFNYASPKLAAEDLNPDMGLLSNRPRKKGVVEKCHFCLHKTRNGEYPACVEACPTGSRKFGNILDPESEVSYIIKNKRVFILKEDLGTIPRFFYYFDV